MTGHGQKFGRKKEEAISALLSQRNMEEAARVAGIGTKTLLRWLKIPEFQAAYRQARRRPGRGPLHSEDNALTICLTPDDMDL